MFVKLFHFLALFGYINILAYEASCSTVKGNSSFFDGDSFIEFVLEDVLHIPYDEQVPDAEVLFEEYRIFSSGKSLLPILFFLTTLLFSVRYYTEEKQTHPFYTNKSTCLPGYYSFLFRYKLF